MGGRGSSSGRSRQRKIPQKESKPECNETGCCRNSVRLRSRAFAPAFTPQRRALRVVHSDDDAARLASAGSLVQTCGTQTAPERPNRTHPLWAPPTAHRTLPDSVHYTPAATFHDRSERTPNAPSTVHRTHPSHTHTSPLPVYKNGDCPSEAAQRLNTSWSVSAAVNPTIGVNVMLLSPWMLWRWSTLLSKTASGIDVGERVTGLIGRRIKRSVW